jgi:hypothetical protein
MKTKKLKFIIESRFISKRLGSSTNRHVRP